MTDLKFISTCNELDEALEFLAAGFDWVHEYIQLVKHAIKESNNFDKYPVVS